MPKLTVSTECVFEDIPIELERAIKAELTIDNPRYIAAKRYGRWIGKNLKPKLKYYSQWPGKLFFPRGFGNQAVLLCREHTGKNPEIIDQRQKLSPVNFNFSGKLRPYQHDGVERILRGSFGVLEAGTGSGKTVMALAVIAKRRQPTLVIVHTKELLYQWHDRAQEFLGISPGLIGDSHMRIEDLTIGIVNSVRTRCDKLAPQFGHLIVDECHRVPATLFTDVVSTFDCWYMLGLSATAFRSDDGTTKLIYTYMGDRLHQVDRNELEQTGAVVRPTLVRRKTNFTYGYRGEYQKLITALTKHEGRNRQIVEDICQIVAKKDGGTILVVSDRVSHCKVFEELLQRRGVNVALLTGKTPPEQRCEIVKSVIEGEVDVLISTLQLIGEGFDCPDLTTLVLTTPITFEGRLLQVIGRIMRPGKNKEAKVYDYVDDAIPVLRRSARAREKVFVDM